MRRLLIRPGAIGDCLLSFPALEFLRTDYTEVWVPRAVVPLVQFADKTQALADTGIDMVGLGDMRADARFRAKLSSFDEVVSWYGANRPEFREAIAGANCVFHQALPSPECTMHATDFFCSQVGAPLGSRAKLSVEAHATRDAVVIHPFSGSQRKNWPLANFRELAKRLPLPVEWTAGPDEDLPEACRFESLADLAQWIAGARFYLGNDSGITHLAAAIGVPVLALFGPTDPILWAPRGKRVVVLRHEPLDDLSVDIVVQVMRRAGF